MKDFTKGALTGAVLVAVLWAAYSNGEHRAEREQAARPARVQPLHTTWHTGHKCKAFCATRGSREQQRAWNRQRSS